MVIETISLYEKTQCLNMVSEKPLRRFNLTLNTWLIQILHGCLDKALKIGHQIFMNGDGGGTRTHKGKKPTSVQS